MHILNHKNIDKHNGFLKIMNEKSLVSQCGCILLQSTRASVIALLPHLVFQLGNGRVMSDWAWTCHCNTSGSPIYIYIYIYMHRTDSRHAPSQWETSLQSNTVSHWLGANLESALYTQDCTWVPENGQSRNNVNHNLCITRQFCS